jgi:hypothetical protein
MASLSWTFSLFWGEELLEVAMSSYGEMRGIFAAGEGKGGWLTMADTGGGISDMARGFSMDEKCR